MAQRLQPEKQTSIGGRRHSPDPGSRPRVGSCGSRASGRNAQDSRRAPATTVSHLLGAFLGYRSDVPDLLDRCGILLAPCPMEGLGLSVLEAMQSGLPVVAANAAAGISNCWTAWISALFTAGDAAMRPPTR